MFCSNRENREETPFGRAMAELEVAMLPSSSLQAWGRVERAHSTAQARLTKELANRVILSGGETPAEIIAAANAYLPRWIEGYNRRYAAAAADARAAHQPLTLSDEELSFVFSTHARRNITASGDFSLDGKRYQIDNLQALGRWRRASGCYADIYRHYLGRMAVLCGERLLRVTCIGAGTPEPPAATYPWKAASYQMQMAK